MVEEPSSDQAWDAFGAYLRSQRQLAQLSLRQLAELTRISNPYLSQIERGLHQPSIGVIKSLAEALNLSVSELLAQAANIVSNQDEVPTTEQAIRVDPRLSDSQKSALLAVYASMVDTTGRGGTGGDHGLRGWSIRCLGTRPDRDAVRISEIR